MSEREGGLLGILKGLLEKKPHAVAVGQGRPVEAKKPPTGAEHARGGGREPAAEETKKSSKSEAVSIAPVTSAAKAEVPTEQRALRDRLQEQAMAEHKLPYNRLSVGAKLKLLNEQLGEQPDPKAVVLKAKLEELQKVNWEQPTPEQWQQVERTFGDMPEKLELPEAEKAILTHVQLAVARQVEDNLPKYGLGERGLNEMSKALKFSEIQGGAGPVAPGVATEWWATERNGHRAILYGADPLDKLFGPVTVPEIESLLTEAQQRIDDVVRNPLGAQDPDLMEGLVHRFQRQIDEFVRVNPITPIPDNVLQYRNALFNNYEELHEMNRDHISLGLSRELKKVVWREGPEGALYKQIREAEELSKSYEGDTFAAQQAVQVLEYMQRYIKDPEFAQDWYRYQLSQPGHVPADDIKANIDRFVQQEVKTLSEIIDWRRVLLKNYLAYTAVGFTEEKTSQLLSPLGTEGTLGVLGLHDGKVQTAFDYFDAAVMSEHRARHSDDLQWLSPTELKELYKRATREMVNGGTADLAGLSQREIEEIAFLAQEVHFLYGRPILAMNRGLSPIESGFYDPGTRPEKLHPFSGGGGSNLERAASAREALRFGFYRWMLENRGVAGHLDGGAQFAARGNHVKSIVNELVAGAQRRGQVEDLVRYMCEISTEDARSAGVVKAKLKNFYFDFDLKGGRRSPPTTLPEAAANIPLLKERLMSKIGIRIMENSLMDYTMLDSGPMTYHTITKLTEMFSYADQLAISMRVRRAYEGVIGARNPDDRETAITTLRGVLAQAARYNPVDLLNGHLDTRNFETQDWFRRVNLANVSSFLSAGEVAAGGVTCTGDLVKVLTRRVASIESLIKRKVREGFNGWERDTANIPKVRIDWQQPLTPAHETVVVEVLRIAKGLPAGSTAAQVGLPQFVEIMKSVSDHVIHPSRIEAATKQNFIVKYGYQTMNSMDCWLDLAEARFTPTQTHLQGHYGDRQVETEKLSIKLGARSSGDLLVRAHGDTETALKAKDIIFQAIQTQDWKQYIKAVHEIRSHIRNVYGTPWDGRSIMYYTAGLMEAMSQDKLTEWTFDIMRTLLIKDSKLRRLLNSEHAASIPVEQRHEHLGELENTIMQNLEDYDEELAKTFLEYVGLNLGKGHSLVQNDILWAKRIYRVTVFAAILLAAASVKQGVEELGVSGGGARS